jgi:integrase
MPHGRCSFRSFGRSLTTELARRANQPDSGFRPYAAAHLALGCLKRNPGKLLELATLLGHESLGTTAIYALPSEED